MTVVCILCLIFHNVLQEHNRDTIVLNYFTQTLSKRTVNHRIYRWALELENYNYTIHHRSGSNMGHVDALSRCDVIAFVQAEDVDFQLQVTQTRDPVIVDLRSSLETTKHERFVL